MNFTEVFLLAVGLAGDAFAAAVCRGLGACRLRPRDVLCVGLWFGGFQAAMPLLGYALGGRFAGYVQAFSHLVVFLLLSLIGGNMIRESFTRKASEATANFRPFSLFLSALTTSVDALGVGVTFAANAAPSPHIACAVIGGVTFLLSAAGVLVGHKFGIKYKSRAEFCGGALLVSLGVKALLQGIIA